MTKYVHYFPQFLRNIFWGFILYFRLIRSAKNSTCSFPSALSLRQPKLTMTYLVHPALCSESNRVSWALHCSPILRGQIGKNSWFGRKISDPSSMKHFFLPFLHQLLSFGLKPLRAFLADTVSGLNLDKCCFCNCRDKRTWSSYVTGLTQAFFVRNPSKSLQRKCGTRQFWKQVAAFWKRVSLILRPNFFIFGGMSSIYA